MQNQTQVRFEKVFLRIADNPSFKPILYSLQYIPGYEITFMSLTQAIFDILVENKGTHLSIYEFQSALNSNTEITDRLFNAINTSSKNISYLEFHDFISRGSAQDIMELIETEDVMKKLNIYISPPIIPYSPKPPPDDSPKPPPDDSPKPPPDDFIIEPNVVYNDSVSKDENCFRTLMDRLVNRFNLF